MTQYVMQCDVSILLLLNDCNNAICVVIPTCLCGEVEYKE